jgi:prepilin-type N-terminal cleavage/methylation domain-containing protein
LSHLLYFFGIRKGKKIASSGGFSLIELLVVLSIVLIITTVVLLDYPLFGANQALNISAQEVGQVIREAQLFGISVKESKNCADPVTCQFPNYGIYFTLTGGSNLDYSENIVIFADLNKNGIYDSGDAVDRTYVISAPSYINAVCYSLDGGNTWKGATNVDCGAPGGLQKATIIFKRPNPEPVISVVIGGAPPITVDALKINVRGPGVLEKDINVSRFGQVSVGEFKKGAATSQTCPYVYSWNGTEYVYEHRGLALSGIGKKQTNVRMLRSLSSVNNELSLRVFEDFDETHVDGLEVKAVDIPASSQAVVYPDTTGNFRTFKDGVSPHTCTSGGVDCQKDISLLGDKKEVYFGAVTKDADSPQSSDVLLDFPVFATAQEAKLLLKLETDDSLYKVFPNMYKAVGPLVYMVMAHPELRKLFNVDKTIDDLSLRVLVWNGSEWQPVAGEVPSDLKSPEELLFSIKNVPHTDGVLHLRVTSLFRYHLDYAALDTSADEPMNVVSVPLLRASYEGNEETKDLSLAINTANDKKEALLTAGNSFLAVFSNPPQLEGTKRLYASLFTGYYLQKTPKTIEHSFSPSAVFDAFKMLNQKEGGAPEYLFENYAK